jgi:hypothetical protein
MSTLPPPGVKKFPEDSLEKQVYKVVEDLKDHIPVKNDRYRLAFNLFKYIKGEGDSPEILVKTSKIKVTGISLEELASRLKTKLAALKK